MSGQIIVPINVQNPAATGSGGGAAKPFMVASEVGENVGDVLQKIQSKLAREVFFGQRQIIFLGEGLAKKGLRGLMDNTTRLSEASIRTDLFVIRGGTALDVLKLGGTLEVLPVLGALKKHERSGGRGDTTFLDYLIAANRDGIHPTLPVAEVKKSEGMDPPTFFQITGVAVLDGDLKLAGYLTLEENRFLLWLLDKLRSINLTAVMDGGDVSAQFFNLRSRIKPSRNEDGSWHFDIALRGEGSLVENNASLMAGKKHVLAKIERAIEKQAAEHVKETIRKVQEQFGLDVFGFGVVVHRKFPYAWPALKDRWDEEFRRATFRVKTDLDLERPGLTSKPAT